jgi:hypothetical protein
MPSVVAEMLIALRAEPGMNVLEMALVPGGTPRCWPTGSAASTSPR